MNNIKSAIYYGRELFLAGVNNGANGNISFRKRKNILISRSGSVMSELTKKDLVNIDSKQASSESSAHKIIYNNPQINAVLHTHSANAIALSLKTKGKTIKPLDLEGKYHCPTIPIISTKLVPGAEDLPEKLFKHIDCGIVIVKGHGVFTFGKDIKECYLKAITTDNICKINLSLLK